jgi:hypothetical protein
MTHARLRLRSVALLGVAALAAPLLPATGASAAPAIVLRDVREFACPPGQVDSAGFTDIGGDTFRFEINCFAGFGITGGTGDGTTYSPAADVSRSQMAVFLVRILERADVDLDFSSAGFTDIAGQTAEARNSINALANLGVVNGTTPTTYGPQGAVSRAAMATFIAGVQAELGEEFAAGEDFFTDDDGTTHEPNINKIAAAGVAGGTSEGMYSEERNVSRGQMAGFLTRFLDIQVEDGTVPAEYPRNNEVLAISPADEETVTADQSRTYTVTGLDNAVEYRVTLVAPATVSVNEDDKTTRFTDTDGDQLAEVGTYAADITSINGREVARTDGAPSTTTSMPDDGQITVVVSGEQGDDSVRPVVYPNTGRSPRLELATDLRPVEAFGIGGAVTFTVPEAQSSTEPAEGIVTAHDRTRSRVTVDTSEPADGVGDVVYAYDPNNGGDDTYAINGTAQPRDEFVARLTRGDLLEIERYSATEEGVSRFNIADDTPTAPEVDAEAGESGATTDDITVTVDPGNPAAVTTYDSFVIERAPVSGGDPRVGCPPASNANTGAFAEVATAESGQDADAKAAGFQYIDRDVAQGCFVYRAAGVVDGQRGGFGRSDSVGSITPATDDNTRPTSTDARNSRDFGSAGVADAGDRLTIVFDENLASPAADAFLRVRTTDGQLVTIRNRSNSLFSVSGNTLSIDLNIGFNAGPYPLEIVEAGRITDVAGNTYDVVNSADKVIDIEPAGS